MEKNIKIIAEMLGAKEWRVKESLGIKLKECHAKNVKEAKAVYDSSLKDSEEERSAFLKWEELSLQEVLRVSTVEQIQAVYRACPRGSKAIHAASIKWVDICATKAEVEAAFHYITSDEEGKMAASLKWIELCRSIKEVKAILRYVPIGGQAEASAIRKIQKLLN